MKNNVLKLDEYTPQQGDCLFFDTNIWLYLLAPTPPGNKYEERMRQKVSSFYKKTLQSRCQIFISSLVISEFFNAFCRIRFNVKKSILEKNSNSSKVNFEYKKHFRPTQEYCELVEEVVGYINFEILDVAKKVDDSFTQMQSDSILDIGNSYDFNDKYISELCSINKLKIVTADKDYILASPRTDLIMVN